MMTSKRTVATPESKLEDVELGNNNGETREQSNETEDSSASAQGEETTLSDGQENEAAKRRAVYIKAAVGVLLLAFVTFVIVDTITTGRVAGAVEDFLQWVEDNPVEGVFLFVIVYFVATILFIPGSILTLGAGFVFAKAFGIGGGVALGVLSVFLGASAGATASFLLGRYLLRDQVNKLTKKYAVFEALDATLQENGFKIFLLLRLSPIIPFNAINYIGGVSSVSLRDYVLALFGILPGTILYVFLGASAGSLTDSADSSSDPTVTIIVVVLGLVFGVLAIWLTTRYARKELSRVMEERQQSIQAANATVDGDHDLERDTASIHRQN